MKLSSLPVVACLLCSFHAAHAGVVVGGIRVVYHGEKKESSLRIENPDKTPYLIQSWVEATEGASKKLPLSLHLLFFVWMRNKRIYYVSSRRARCRKIRNLFFG